MHISNQIVPAMAEEIITPTNCRYALVTGANKGIGFEICRQLASNGVLVILTSRNDKRGIEAVERLKEFGLSGHVLFHQLDVVDVASVAAAADFVKTKYGRLDILVNNAGTAGIGLDGDASIIQELVQGDAASVFADGQPEVEPVQLKASGSFIETYEGAEGCVQINYYGAKRVTEALIPLLQLSDSPRIVNVSSILGSLRLLQHERAKSVLRDEVNLTEERIDEVVQEFLKNFKEGSKLEENKWPTQVAAYKVSKAALTAYTQVIAKKHTRFCINSLCPGFARTDITCNLGPLSPSEAAENAVRLALLPDGGPSGTFYFNKDAYSS